MEQCEFSDYFTNCITKALLAGPKQDVTTIKVDLKLSTLNQYMLKRFQKYTNIWKVIRAKKSYWIEYEQQVQQKL